MRILLLISIILSLNFAYCCDNEYKSYIKSGNIQYNQKKYKKALMFFKIGLKTNDPFSQYSVATLYANGKGVARNLDYATKLLNKAKNNKKTCKKLNTYVIEALQKISDYIVTRDLYELASQEN